jgi:threonylcarbamoyladenosine tRNA methylthiotransferase MtaB
MTNGGKTVAFHTLGCKLNYSESSALARLFSEKGFARKDFSDSADVYVLNTCSVTANADQECRSLVRGALARNPDAFVAVIGCYAQLKPGEIAAIPGVDVVLGASEKFRLLNYISLAGKHSHAQVHNCDIDDVNSFSSAYSLGDRTRSFLKVQDGCDYSCTFCTIPLARGKSRSDSIERVVANAEAIAASGVSEIVLTGVNLGDFGYVAGDETRPSRKLERFSGLIRELEKVKGIARFRISSIEPNLLDDDIISFVAGSERFAPHFHMPLQSGSNELLKRMKRRYNRELYARRVELIRQLMPHACIGADVIVGFPGETDEHFMETYRFLADLDVSYLHVFTYSERDNTEAAGMPGVVPVHERKRRNKMLRTLSARKLRAFYESQRGRELEVIFERNEKSGRMEGYSENYVRLSAPFDAGECNRPVRVTAGDFDEEGNLSCVLPVAV